MAASTKSKKNSKKQQEEPGALREWVQWSGDVCREAMATLLAEHTWRVIGAVAIVGVVTAWAVARGPLMEKVGRSNADPIGVEIAWPVTSDGESWLPESVKGELERIAHASLTMDPFDREALERTATELEKTGWLSTVSSVRREPGALVRVEGEWRAHAAVVQKSGERFLVGTAGELLKGPAEGMDISRMYVIREPAAQVPTRRDGTVAYGVAWLGAVDDSIALLRSIDVVSGSARISGVDLSRFSRDGHLVLTTDNGSRIVWGSPLGSEAPGEATPEQKMSNLRGILANGDDLRHRTLEIVLPRIEIDVRSRG